MGEITHLHVKTENANLSKAEFLALRKLKNKNLFVKMPIEVQL